MQKYTLLSLILLLWSAWASAQSPAWRLKVAPEVLAAFNRGETADVLIIFREQADVSAARQLHGKAARAGFVFQRLQQTAERSQANARRLLRERNAFANSFYLVNAIAVAKADAALAELMATLPEVERVAADPWVQFAPPMPSDHAVVTERNTVEWGIAKINAPAVWALGYTGQGVTVGGADTGYNWDHPALITHYRGWNGANPPNHNYNWHDAIHEASPLNDSTTSNPCGYNAPAPCDDQQHGTHTMGTMVGDDGAGNQIGVAPGAKWVGCHNMDRNSGQPSTYIECFEWFLAPTDLNGQNPDPSKAPDVINNSWYCSYGEGCTDLDVNELMRQAVINLKAAGVVVVVSNGNNGGICGTTNDPPAYFEESFSVGATRQNDTIASFSSRGPVLVDGSFRIKPNVSAPGVGVRSSVPNNGYSYFNGTSMAGPHVVGLVALMLSANPELSGEVETIETIVEQTAVFLADTLDCGPGSLGNARPNHAYGWGRVDAYAAVQAALSVGTSDPQGQLPAVFVTPNPVTDEAVFMLENCRGQAKLEVFSVNGQLVATQTFTGQGQDTRRVSLREAPAGVYLYQLSADSGTVSGKLVKR